MYAFELRIFLKVILLEGVSVEIIKSHAFSLVVAIFNFPTNTPHGLHVETT